MAKKQAGSMCTWVRIKGTLPTSLNTPSSLALLAMKGMMVQDELTLDDALKIMEEGQKTPNRPAPKLPPKMLGESF